MQQEKNKKASLVFWILTIICMGIIFYFSSRTSVESSQQSGQILDWLIAVFGDNLFTTFIVRKSAHFMEYLGLCLLFNTALYFTAGKKKTILAIACTSLYAVTDEIHQIFVDGRSCEFRDWAIDTAGAIIGAIAFLALFCIIAKIVKKVGKKSANLQ